MPLGASRRPRSWRQRQIASSLIAQWHRLLQRLPLERRRKVLERFTASQKRALECWILGNAVAVPQAFGPRRVTLASTLKEQSPAVGTGSSQNIVRYKRGKVTYYAAQMHLGSGLRMLSKTERCLQVAQSHELLLRRVRETCRSAVVHDECMGQAIRESLADLADEAKRIGLRFVVQIRIPWSCCALTSPPFRLRNLELGLRSWQRLHEARTAISSLAKRTRRGRANLAEPGVQRAWQQLREAYLASTKHSPRAISRLQLLEGGLVNPTATVGAMNLIHLAFAGQDASGYPSGMTVSWFSRDEPKDSTVQYGLSASQLDQSATGHVKHYMRNAGFHSHVEILNLKPSTMYFYRVGSSKDSKWSEVWSFVSASQSADASFSMAVFGDMGWESSVERPMIITAHGLEKKWSAKESRATLEKWKDEKSIDFIWHVGDIGYMDDSYAHSPLRFTYETAYHGYLNWLQNLTATMPYMVSPGNHESECHSPACVVDPFLGRALMNFTAFNHRWHMPSSSCAGRANMWYSFNVGPVHFVSLNTETDFPGAEEAKTGDGHFSWLKAGGFGAEGEYLRWLEADLKAARDAGKKWIIAGGHRPLMRLSHSGMIELLEKYKVDLYFAGHAHKYWRDPPSADVNASAKFYKDPKGYIQVVAGGAGCDEMAFKVAPQCPAGEGTCVRSEQTPDEDPAKTSQLNPVYATDVYSVGRLNVKTSALHFELIDSKHGQLLDEVVVTKTARASLTQNLV